MDKAARLGSIFFHDVESVEITPLQRDGGATWHDIKINGYSVIVLCTKGKDLVQNELDKEAFYDNSADLKVTTS